MTLLFKTVNTDIFSKKIDIRRKRRFGREFTVTFEIASDSKYDAAWTASSYWANYLKEYFQKTFGWTYLFASINSFDEGVYAQFKCVVVAPKPSKILGEDSLPTHLPLALFNAKALELLQAEHDKCAERDQVHEDAVKATEIRDELSQAAREKALAITRFKQRLAGLVAEFEAEALVQIESLINSMNIDELLYEGVSQRAIEVGISAGRNYATRSPLSGPFYDSPNVSQKEVAAHSVESE